MRRATEYNLCDAASWWAAGRDDPQKRPQHYSRCPRNAKGVRTIRGELGQMATDTWSHRLYSAPSAFSECTCLCLQAHTYTKHQIPLTRELNQNPLAPLRSASEGRRRKLLQQSQLPTFSFRRLETCCGCRTKSDRTCKTAQIELAYIMLGWVKLLLVHFNIISSWDNSKLKKKNTG